MIYFVGGSTALTAEEEENITYCTLDEAYHILKKHIVLGLDIETTQKYNRYENEGLDPYTSKIVMVQIGTIEDQVIIDYRYTNSLGKIRRLLEDPKRKIVGHNLKFEYKHLKHNENVIITNLYDTMIGEQILDCGKQFRSASLKAVYKAYFNVDIEKGIRTNFLYIGSRAFSMGEIEYGAKDVVYPLQIMLKQVKSLVDLKLNKCMSLEMKFIPVLGDIELNGMHFDQQHWLNIYEKNKLLLESKKIHLDKFVLSHYPLNSCFIEEQLDLFDSDPKVKINWGSSKQVIELFKDLGICPQAISKTTKKMAYTVNATTLRTHKLTIKDNYLVDLIDSYLSYKETEQRCTTFGKDFLKYVNPITNRIHSDYKQILNTGRISSKNPNLQNIPSDTEFRKAFNAPRDSKIVNADYSGQEQIILANKSLAPNLLEFYNSGKTDMHSYVASLIYKYPYESYIDAKANAHDSSISGVERYIIEKRLEERQIAKAAGFAINYGGNGYTISKNLGISEEEGNYVYEEYFKSFPGLRDYFDKVQDDAMRRGYILIDPLTGRKNFYIKPRNNKETNAVKRAALNFPIQGEAGSITKLATILFRKSVMQKGLQSMIAITNIIHDEINVEAEFGYTVIARKLLTEAMEKAGSYWCKTIPLTADAVASDYWTH